MNETALFTLLAGDNFVCFEIFSLLIVVRELAYELGTASLQPSSSLEETKDGHVTARVLVFSSVLQ